MSNMNVLKRLRTEKGFSLRKLAVTANLDQSTICLLENDRKKAMLITLTKLARALDVPLEELLELQDNGAAERGRKGAAARLAKRSTASVAHQEELAKRRMAVVTVE